jgi:hypothetical protein
MLGYLYRKRFGSKIASTKRKEGDRVGAGQSTETGCGGNNPYEGPRWVEIGRIGVSHGIVEVKLLCIRWLSTFLKLE